MSGNHLSVALSVAVPLYIIQLEQAGGPSEGDISSLSALSRVLAERGDVLLYGGKKQGEAAAIFNQLAKSVAVMAFAPGGITVFGQHYETKVRH